MLLREFKEVWVEKLNHLYDERESIQILRLYLEEVEGWAGMDWLLRQDEPSSVEFQRVLDRLVTGEPIQHILGYEEFMGLRFIVNNNVLVPRPETEELVRYLIDEIPTDAAVLDVGTGSGCIALSLKKYRPDLSVTGLDVSDKALEVARGNGESLDLDVTWKKGDALSSLNVEGYDVIVSNPPYIEEKERVNMSVNVKDFDPQIALFVEDGDPLVFYRQISISASIPEKRAMLAFECHVDHVNKVAELVAEHGWQRVDILDDITARGRFVIARS